MIFMKRGKTGKEALKMKKEEKENP